MGYIVAGSAWKYARTKNKSVKWYGFNDKVPKNVLYNIKNLNVKYNVNSSLLIKMNACVCIFWQSAEQTIESRLPNLTQVYCGC